MVIHAIAGTTDVNAVLPVLDGTVLVALSVILTLIGGLHPVEEGRQERPGGSSAFRVGQCGRLGEV